MDTNELKWHPDAILEAEESRDWYAGRSPLAARGFLLSLRKALDSVLESPERWPMGRHGCRRRLFPGRYPYTLVYRIRDGIEVVAVAHQKRHPTYWSHR